MIQWDCNIIIVSLIQLLINTNFLHQSSFYISNILSSNAVSTWARILLSIKKLEFLPFQLLIIQNLLKQIHFIISAYISVTFHLFNFYLGKNSFINSASKYTTGSLTKNLLYTWFVTNLNYWCMFSALEHVQV